MAGTDNPSDSAATKKFRMAAHVAMALKRFQASMNPTYSYGKKPGKTGAPLTKYVRKDTQAARPSVDSAQYRHHGHKASLLVRSLAGNDASETTQS